MTLPFVFTPSTDPYPQRYAHAYGDAFSAAVCPTHSGYTDCSGYGLPIYATNRRVWHRRHQGLTTDIALLLALVRSYLRFAAPLHAVHNPKTGKADD